MNPSVILPGQTYTITLPFVQDLYSNNVPNNNLQAPIAYLVVDYTNNNQTVVQSPPLGPNSNDEVTTTLDNLVGTSATGTGAAAYQCTSESASAIVIQFTAPTAYLGTQALNFTAYDYAYKDSSGFNHDYKYSVQIPIAYSSSSSTSSSSSSSGSGGGASLSVVPGAGNDAAGFVQPLPRAGQTPLLPWRGLRRSPPLLQLLQGVLADCAALLAQARFLGPAKTAQTTMTSSLPAPDPAYVSLTQQLPALWAVHTVNIQSLRAQIQFRLQDPV